MRRPCEPSFRREDGIQAPLRSLRAGLPRTTAQLASNRGVG
jgi:hypothetical protein